MKKYQFLPALFLLTATLGSAQTEPTLDPGLGISTLQLWPAGAPEIAGTNAEDLPTLTVFLPQKGRNTGSAVIVAPGGAYLGLASTLEGRQVADWFTVRGMTAFVLKYRLGAKYLYPIPLQPHRPLCILERDGVEIFRTQPVLEHEGRCGWCVHSLQPMVFPRIVLA